MMVAARDKTLQSEYKGNTIYFCSAHGKKKFDRIE
jgi:YHS domain-containing protein